MDNFPFEVWATIVYIVLATISLLIALIVLMRLLRKIGGVWARSGTLFGGDTKTRLISLGVATLLFPRVLTALVNSVILFIGDFFVDAPQALLTYWQTTMQSCQGYIHSSQVFLDCSSQLSFGFIQAWTSALSNSLTRFGPTYLPYSEMILMLAVWATVALFLSVSRAGDDGNASQRRMWLQNALNDLSYATKQNLLFFLILALAGYLSIAAIAAIPGLQETPTSEAVSTERLEQQLAEALTQSQTRIPQEVGLSSPFADLDEYFGANPASDPNDKMVLAAMKEWRQTMLNLYPKLLQNVQSRADNAKSSAIAVYRAGTVGRKGTQETVQHFLDIHAWFRRTLDALEAQILHCRTEVEKTDSFIQIWAIAMREQLRNGERDQYQATEVFPAMLDARQAAFETCLSLPNVEPVPERPDLGSRLGPFRYVASWLLRTESLPLAQIVGLLGFGLLGSAVSSLVRYGTKRQKNAPLVEELATVVIQGATAAIVVFLAVKGGLAIFASGGTETNSYVLLLTCLVAAVFSEDVWREAHKRLRKVTEGEGELEKPTEPKTESALLPATTDETRMTGTVASDEEIRQ